MARMILSAVLVCLLLTLVGCYPIDSGASQLKTGRVKPELVEANEADLVEQVSSNRIAYRRYLESLMAHYENIGNNMKLSWAKRELRALNKLPRYNYVVDAIVAGPDLRASDSIELADYVYKDIVRLENRAKGLLVIYDENLLRKALDRYNQFIRKYPTSDKIDDAAYKAGGICEDFHDFTIAVLYYQRAYQWEPETKNPAKFKAAYILDRHLSRRSEALELYQEVVEQKILEKNYLDYSRARITGLTRTRERLE